MKGLTKSLPDIEEVPEGVFVMHEKFERFIDLHQHSKGQLSYIEGGIAYITINHQTYVVPSHYFFWIPVGIPHVLRVTQRATSICSIYFGLTEVEKEESFFQELGIYPASELLIQMIQFTSKWSGQMLLPGDQSYLFLRAMLQVMVPQRELTVPIVLPVSENEKLQHVLDYLSQNLEKPHSLESVSKQFHTSERTLSRIFQNELKMSFLQYLKHLRIIKSIELLQKTNLSISEIAEKVGYNTLGAFSNTFFELTKMRPSEMRNYFYK